MRAPGLVHVPYHCTLIGIHSATNSVLDYHLPSFGKINPVPSGHVPRKSEPAPIRVLTMPLLAYGANELLFSSLFAPYPH